MVGVKGEDLKFVDAKGRPLYCAYSMALFKELDKKLYRFADVSPARETSAEVFSICGLGRYNTPLELLETLAEFH